MLRAISSLHVNDSVLAWSDTCPHRDRLARQACVASVYTRESTSEEALCRSALARDEAFPVNPIALKRAPTEASGYGCHNTSNQKTRSTPPEHPPIARAATVRERAPPRYSCYSRKCGPSKHL
ncbi:hypothetical protein EIQ20_11030 [Xanthomonas campestris pv. campestris]